MKPGETTGVPLTGAEGFVDLVQKLRLDFRRLFPHLCAREEQCFFVRQNVDKTSGKVWIEFVKNRDPIHVKCVITIWIKDNRAVRRAHQEFELDESLEHTEPCGDLYTTRAG